MDKQGYWLPKQRILYSDIPKTASRSMLQYMNTRFGQRPIFWERESDPKLAFCILRNPYSRAMSIWWSACQQPDDRYNYHRFGRTPTTMVLALIEGEGKNIDLGFTQAEILAERQQHANMVWIRYEHLDYDIAMMLGDAEVTKLPVLNKKKSGHPPPTYSREFIEAVNEWSSNDFGLGGYAMLTPSEEGE